MSEGQWPRGSIPRPRSGVAAGRSYPTSEERWLCRRRRAERSYSTFKAKRGGGKEIPLVQGKEGEDAFCLSSHEEIPHVKGKRNPSKTVGVVRGQQRADTLKP